MLLYGVDPKISSVQPGDSYSLFDGTEIPGASIKSAPFSRGESPSGSDQGSTFSMDFVSAPTAVVLIQGANVDAEANYVTLWTSTNTQHDNYTDTARWAFYRAVLSTYSAGGMPVVRVKR